MDRQQSNHSLTEINDELKTSNYIDSENETSIKVLDIFGFESGQKNSFEEFCVNYVNECLQNFLNQKTFKLQQVNMNIKQDEYEEEGFEWNRISYADNSTTVDLFRKRPSGLLNLLEDECKSFYWIISDWLMGQMKIY
ncbi:Unconventional myosin-IXa [Thelohanellus kitauei]|uniref:Unconventional myosin-IXa n=1 Tax=Thelohanellus kitauei TaxID=669202 RepID=A0A0C2IWP4_THEKT|nr:Unconventional myosin-IXa [Thelohanellus kitauei]